MNLTNYHSHCTYCDGRGTIEEFIQSAIEQGYTSYGLTSHAPLPFKTKWNMDIEDLEAYLQECKELKEKYASQIDFLYGLEIDYLNSEHHPANSFFSTLELDYRIGSVHLLQLDDGEVIDIDASADHFRGLVDNHFNGELEEIIHRYYTAMLTLIDLGGFDILGHCDKISKNASDYHKGICESSFYKNLIRDYFEQIAAQEVLVEINTKSFVRSGHFFPNIENFGLLRELEIPVTVNSDAHDLHAIHAGRKEALQGLYKAGYETVMELENKKWIEQPIHSLYR